MLHLGWFRWILLLTIVVLGTLLYARISILFNVYYWKIYPKLVVVKMWYLKIWWWDHGWIVFVIIIFFRKGVSTAPSTTLTLVLVHKTNTSTFTLSVEVSLGSWVFLSSCHWLRKHGVKFLWSEILLSALRWYWRVIELQLWRVLDLLVDCCASL